MTLGELRTRIARVAGMSTNDATDLSLIDGWVNEAVLNVLARTKVNRLTASLATTANTEDYTLDEDILSVEDLWYAPDNGQSVLLEQTEPREIQRMRLTQSGTGNPCYYALVGAHLLMLYPTPASGADMVHMIYVPRPGVISDPSHSPEDDGRGKIPSEYHHVIEAYAKWKATETEEHKPSGYGKAFLDQYELGVRQIIASLNRKSGRLPRAVVGRAPFEPASNGVYPRY